MKVGELISKLMEYPYDEEVYFSYNYGDRSNTEAAEPVRRCESKRVAEWPYGNCDRVIDENDTDRVNEKTKEVLVLS